MLFIRYQWGNQAESWKIYNTSFKQITNWVHRFEKDGVDGLKDKEGRGRTARLNEVQRKRIGTLLSTESPTDHAYNSATWTGPMLIEWVKSSVGYKGVPKIILVLDNVAYHHAKKISKWLEKHPVLELFFLPPYSPDLNAVERAWWYMRKKITHNRYLKTLKERKVAFWKMFSHFLKPNVELKTVCEINY